ncbi:MAG: hypothetical protein IJZ79_01705 [Bacilli bacterium]|nr:hypothetical protein [Bacilli bacterium]
MAIYGSENEDTVITQYLDSHLENGIKQKNLDFILDLIDLYVDLVESIN